MPRYRGPIEVGTSGILLSSDVLAAAFTEDFDVSKHSGRWVGAGVCIRKVWKDVSASGDNWGQGPNSFTGFRLVGSGPWNRFGILVTSAHLWTNIGGAGTYNIGCGTENPVPSQLNVLNQTGLSAGLEYRLGDQVDFDPSFERGRLVDNVSWSAFWVNWDGTSLTSGPTGSVSLTVFGVLVPDPRISDS